MMIANSESKVEPSAYKECGDIMSYFNLSKGGINFCCLYYNNTSVDHVLIEEVKFDDTTIKFYPPYDQKLGSASVRVEPGKKEVLMFRYLKDARLSYSFSHIIKGPAIDPLTLLSEANKKGQYKDWEGKLTNIFKHSFSH